MITAAQAYMALYDMFQVSVYAEKCMPQYLCSYDYDTIVAYCQMMRRMYHDATIVIEANSSTTHMWHTINYNFKPA